MELPSQEFLSVLLLLAFIVWLLARFGSRILSLILIKTVGISVRFRVSGWRCLRDIKLKFRKGGVELVTVREIRLGIGFISRDPKLQVIICNLQVVTRPPIKSAQKAKTSKPRSSSRSSGKGKLMVVANMARFLSVSLRDIIVKTPKFTIEVKELSIDTFKVGESNADLLFKLKILPITVHNGELTSTGQASGAVMERSASLLSCEEFTISCEFGQDRELGMIIKNVDFTIGEVAAELNEELFPKKKSSSDASSSTDRNLGSTNESVDSKNPQKKQAKLATLTMFAPKFPEKVCFNLPKVDVRFVHLQNNLVLNNNITGIQLRTTKSKFIEDVGESTRLDFQLEFSEIHLVREADTSVLEVLKVDVVSILYIPVEPTSPVRAEIDIKLGGTSCNIIMSRLKPWLQLQSSKKKAMVLKEEKPTPERSPSTDDMKIIVWTSTLSIPEIAIVLYSITDSPLFRVCPQSLHVFANDVSSMGPSVHMELGELNLQLVEGYKKYSKENCVESSLVHVAKVSLDFGKKDTDSVEEKVSKSKCKLVLSVDVTRVSFYFTYKRVELLVSTAVSFQTLLKNPSASGERVTSNRSSKPSGKGAQLLKFSLECCSVNFSGDSGLENTSVADPKRVNYGSQGGQVVISVMDDGSPRTANVMSTVSDERQKLKYSVALDIFQFSLCVNKERHSTQVEVERARSIYQEFMEQRPGSKVTLVDIRHAKFVQRSGGLKEIAVCSLFSATDITLRYEPDVHISLVELGFQLKALVHNQKLQQASNKDVSSARGVDQKKEATGHLDKSKKKEAIFAVDVEMLNISAEAGDGVEVLVRVQSIFSENARIGVLLEGLMLNLQGCRILRSRRMQISRIPSTSPASSDGNVPEGAIWDWIFQGLDIRVCLPFRLELRAIDDAVEDMLRGLKIITAAKSQLYFPVKKEGSTTKKPSPLKFGCLKFFIHRLSAEIEEEPLQGWLDEHYRLRKNEASELAVRLKFLDEVISKGNQSSEDAETQESTSDKKTSFYNGVEIDLQDPLSVAKVQDDIFKQSFKTYYQACQNVVKSEGSGACREGFLAGFKFSTTRTSVLSILATGLDVSLTQIQGGEEGMIEVIKKLDPVIEEKQIPFSRLFGTNMLLRIASLVVNLRDYTNPLLSATSAKCEGCLVLAQQATAFQPQVYQDVFIGNWRKVSMLRSAAGTTPPMKTYTNLPLYFEKAEVSYGVGYEPVFADVSYAFTVALRRAHLSIRNPIPPPQPPKKEKSLPWWDDMRNYVHGKNALICTETRFHLLATTDPYEKVDKLQITSGLMEIHQSDGRIYISAKDFKFYASSLENMIIHRTSKIPDNIASVPFYVIPSFTLELLMEWDCDSGEPLNHYLFALPVEGKSRDIVFDPFRSTSLSLRWDFSLRSTLPSTTGDRAVPAGSLSTPPKSENASPTVTVAPHDVAWLIRFINLNSLPPHKLRMFSRWPRYGVPRILRSGNLPLDRVITEFMLRIDSTPFFIKHLPLDEDDRAKGFTISLAKLKFELCLSRGMQKYTFECDRDLLGPIYQGFDIHTPKIYISREDCITVAKIVQTAKKNSESASVDGVTKEKSNSSSSTEKRHEDGFLLSSDYFTIRKQAPKADAARLLAWQEAGRRNVEMSDVKSEFENGSDSDEPERLDPSDDEECKAVIADNCQRVFVYGLKLLWTIENRDAVCSWALGLAKAVTPEKPSPSRQYAQRKLLEDKQTGEAEKSQDDNSNPPTSSPVANSPLKNETSESLSTPSQSVSNPSSPAVVKSGNVDDAEEEGTCHFMVNVIEPQFNLHSEDANGRLLLAAVSGRVLARSFHSVVQVGREMIEKALSKKNAPLPESEPEMTWKRMEFSAMLEHVQAHVAPTDVDPGAGIQWLPKIHKHSPRVKRTGALLERVFTPFDMFLRCTRHKSGTPELKMKPLKDISFNCHAITASMTSRQYHVMVDVLRNLLFGRPPKDGKSSLTFITEEDDDVEEEVDQVVPDGVEEVELEKINLERKDRKKNVLLQDIRKMSLGRDASADTSIEKEGDLWMATGGRSALVQGLKRELVNAQKSRKEAYASFRVALEKAAQIRLMEKENKSPSFAMRISMHIEKVVWNMLVDGKSFAEAEINGMVFDFDRDYKDIGIAVLTIKYLVLRNCQANAKSDTVLTAWNPPPEWGKKVMVRVDAKQGLPKNGSTVFDLFQVHVYPLKIHMMESTYKVVWDYIFPYEEQDSQRRQEAWKVSTTAGAKRARKGPNVPDGSASSGQTSKESEAPSKSGGSAVPAGTQSSTADFNLGLKLRNVKTKNPPGPTTDLRRTSSFDRTWEETVAESVANELVLQAHSSGVSTPTKAAAIGVISQMDESSKSKYKDPKPFKVGRAPFDEKKVAKVPPEEKDKEKEKEKRTTRPHKEMIFHEIKISQVELCLTYEGSIWVMNDLKLLIDTFHRAEFTGSWMRLAARVKKHVVWGVLKSLTGMQGKKFKDKIKGSHQREPTGTGGPEIDFILSDSEGPGGKSDPLSWPRRPPGDAAGDGFVTSVKGLFTTQRRKAKKFVLRTMRGDGENDFQGEWSESDAEFSPLARQLTFDKAKKLIRRHTNKFKSRKGSSSIPSSPMETSPIYDSDSSGGGDGDAEGGSSPDEDFNE